MSETKELRSMRSMAWERAKGEMRSMLVTYYSSNASESNYNKFLALMENFIKEVEGEGLQE